MPRTLLSSLCAVAPLFGLGLSLAASVAQAQVENTVTVTANPPPRVGNSVRVSTSSDTSFDPYDFNNEAAVYTTVRREWTAAVPVPTTDLSIVKDNGETSVVPGASVTYTITVANQTPSGMGRLFVFINETAEISEVDPADGTVLNSFPSPVMTGTNPDPTGLDPIPLRTFGMATTRTTLLVGGEYRSGGQVGEIFELDPDTGTTLRTLPNPGLEIFAMAFRNGEIFVSGIFKGNPRIAVLDYATGAVKRTLISGCNRNFPLGLAWSGENLSSSGFDFDLLVPLDPQTGFWISPLTGETAVTPFGGGLTPCQDVVDDLDDFNLNAGGEGLGVIGNEVFAAVGLDTIEVFDIDTAVRLRFFDVGVAGQIVSAIGADAIGGGTDVVGATVSDSFAPDLTCSWTCAPSGGASCAAGPVVGDIADTVDIPLGDSVVYTAVCAIDPAASGTLSNTATVAAPAGITDSDQSNDSSTDVDTLTPLADLSITKSDSPDPVAAGEPLSYAIVATNNGPSIAEDLAIGDTLPAGTTFVSAAPSAGGLCATPPVGGTGTVTCTWAGATAVGVSRTLNLVVLVDTATAAGVTISNTATTSSATTDPGPSANSATATTTVATEADLSITKSDSTDPIAPGGTLTYTVEVDNSGPSDAASVVVTDTLPAAVIFGSTSGCLGDPGGVPTCDLGTIPVGGSASYTVEVTVAASTPTGTITNEASVASATNDPSSENNAASEDTLVDADPPVVSLVDSMADTGDGEVEECEEARVAITELLVSFDEPVQDPGGDVDPSDVTNPANYRLLAAGPDRDLATSQCGPALGDDVAISIDSVTYDPGSSTATLAVNGGLPLDDSLYRLLVCGSTTIRDIAGNALDGNADGTGGDDFARTYRVTRNNRFVDGNLDCSIDSWVAISTVPEEIVHSTEDVAGSSLSGSARVTNLTASSTFSFAQCPMVDGDFRYDFQSSVRVAADPGTPLQLSRVCELYSAPFCLGSVLQTTVDLTDLEDTGGEWEPLTSRIDSPAGALSALCSFDLLAPAGDDFEVFLDDLFLGVAPLFIDGFESGDTSAWSFTVP